KTLALGAHTTARLMGQSHHTIDIVKPVERSGIAEGGGYLLGHCSRTVHRGENTDIVAGAHLAVLTGITHKGSALGLGDKISRHGMATKAIVLGKVSHDAVVRMHMLARANIGGRIANKLPIFG